DSLHLDQPEFPGIQIETCEVITQVLFMHVVNVTPLRCFVFHNDAHGSCLSLGIWPEITHLWGFPLGMRQNEHTHHPLHRLQREGTLTLKLSPALLAPREQVCMTRLSLGETTLGACDVLLDFRCGLADLLVDFLKQLSERYF